MELSKIVVGTRPSELAVAQGELVIAQLKKHYPDYRIELKKISTKGDRILDKQLAEISGKGLFIKEIEVALLNGEIDMAVHSYKDLPTSVHDKLKIGAVPKRACPLDVLITEDGLTLDNLPEGAKLGTGSLRRKSQLLHYRSDLEVVPIRGNIDTRLNKMHETDLDGIILAAAGLERMGWQDRITQYLEPEISVPAPRQGALAVEIRRGDSKIAEIVDNLNDPVTAKAVTAEFFFLKELEGGCSVPIGALAETTGQEIEIEGIVASAEGTKIIRDRLKGKSNKAKELGISLANRLIDRGARNILKEIRGGK